jgi:hypothetical protein
MFVEEYNANIEAEDSHGRTAAFMLGAYRLDDVLEYLKSKGANIEFKKRRVHWVIHTSSMDKGLSRPETRFQRTCCDSPNTESYCSQIR